MMPSARLILPTRIRRTVPADSGDVSNFMSPAVGVAFIGLSVIYGKFQMPPYRFEATRFLEWSATIMKRLRGNAN